jgi:NAD/NADP transhydrogenase beta subunit
MLESFFGWAYIVLGVCSYILTGSSHKTALIPSIFGFVFIFIALFSGKSRRRMCVLITISVATVAFLATFRSFEKLPSLYNGTAARPAAVVSQAINAALSAVYIILSVIFLPPPYRSNKRD